MHTAISHLNPETSTLTSQTLTFNITHLPLHPRSHKRPSKPRQILPLSRSSQRSDKPTGCPKPLKRSPRKLSDDNHVTYPHNRRAAASPSLSCEATNDACVFLTGIYAHMRM
ncbi:hypothetical protein B0O99DRAFT_314932 [Bisporella sp. PMI_857]|nr:hypothetical protein B0O99DRAFT_314932 [Bisporella sp. PMI_857]